MTDYCVNNHPYEGDNVRITNIGRRVCMTCRRASNRRSDAKKRARAKAARNDPPPQFDGSNPHREYICQEIEFLAGTDHPENIAQRLGYSQYDNLRLVLRRWQRSDLVQRLERSAA